MTGGERIILGSTLAALAACVALSLACKGKDGEKASQEEATAEKVEPERNEFEESDRDILTVDYGEFYDELEPYGTWVEVNPKKLGLEIEQETASLQRPLLDRMFAVPAAHADVTASASVGAVYVWQPDASLAVSAEAVAGATAGAEAGVAAGAEAGVAVEAEVEEEVSVPEYTPYENGQWVQTDAGWYFHASTEPEEVTSHYGRWTFTASLGWVWLPGTVWAPAWVDWREDDTHVAWTPVPAGVYISGSVLLVPPDLKASHYVVVEKRYFLEPGVYKYKVNVKTHPHKVKIKAMTRINGISVKGKVVHNQGPKVVGIEKASGKKVTKVKIKKVGSKGKVKYSSKKYAVYSPSFTKVKVKASVKGPAVKPKSHVKFKTARASYKARVKVKGPGGKGKVKVKSGKGGGKAHAKVKSGKGGGKTHVKVKSGKGGGKAQVKVKSGKGGGKSKSSVKVKAGGGKKGGGGGKKGGGGGKKGGGGGKKKK
jgi:hypothetical protein